MDSKYLLVGIGAFSGSMIYNGVSNLLLKPNIYESRQDFLNYGMLMGLLLSSGYLVLNNSEVLLKNKN